ncbi:hypothetical protein [Brevundimonas sp.]|uniref:hypothetical protein n=1 Tax=Brevundimonas sp. TaxID=1871086 RepID=UPI003A94EB27
MPFHVDDDQTAAERLAAQAALEEKLRQMQAVTDAVAGWPVTGRKADKTFCDAESGDDFGRTDIDGLAAKP